MEEHRADQRKMMDMVEDVQKHSKAAAQSMLDLTRAVLLAGVGVAGLAVDEAVAYLDKLVERGQIAEKDARRLVEELRQRTEKQAGRAADETERQVTDVLQRMGVPSKTDLTALEAKVATLSEKIDELIASRRKTQPPSAQE